MERRAASISARLALVVALTALLATAAALALARAELRELGHGAALAAAIERSTERIVAAGAACALLGALVAWLLGRRLKRRVRAMVRRTEDFAAGRSLAPPPARVRDDLGVLERSLDFMTDHLATVVSRVTDRSRADAERRVARTIQLALLPAAQEATVSGFELAGAQRPTAEGGGDFWGYHDLDDDRTLVVIGGASGHGVESAMVAAAAKAACDAVRAASGPTTSLTDVLEAMNAAVFQQSRRRLTMTCFVSIVDARRRIMVHANAGHPFAYLLRRGAGGGEFSTLTSRGNRLGEVRESRYETVATDLVGGDSLIWFTDGMLRCENEAGEALGDKRFRAAIRRAGEGAASSIRDGVLSECFAYYGAIPPKQDITLVIGRIT